MMFSALDRQSYRGDDDQRTIALRALFHDLANQLATLSCLVEGLEADPGLPASARRQVAVLRTQTVRMLELLRRAVVERPQPEFVPIRPLIREVVSAANARNEAVVTFCTGDEQWLHTHPSAVWHVLDNIVENAARAAGPGGRVEVSLHRENHNAVIEVADDGPGFGNAPPGAASLGLVIAVSLARQCDGHVEVLPDPHRTRVRLEFPSLQHDEPSGSRHHQGKRE